MPPRTARACTSYPCPNLRPCPLHDRTRLDLERTRNEKRTESLTVYRSARWRRLRKKKLLETPWCETPRCRRPAAHVDHVLAIADGGPPWDESNLASLCHSCHSRKTALDVRRRAAGPRGEGGSRSARSFAAVPPRKSNAHRRESEPAREPSRRLAPDPPSRRRPTREVDR